MLSRRLLRIKVVKALYAHLQSDADSLITTEKNLVHSIDKTYDLYHLVLSLVADVAAYGEKRIEIGKKKRLATHEDLNPNTKFVENAVIAQIARSGALGDYLAAKKLSWANYPELVKELYNALTESDFYKKYMLLPKRTYREDLSLVKNFYTRIVDDNPAVEEAVEEQSILWSDDLDFALIMTLRTLEQCAEGQEDVPLLPKFKSDDDLDYTRELLRNALVHKDEYLEYVERYTQNWDVERIALLDNLIMITAMAELVACPSVPVKVTLDEFIEIAKYYSTPGSSFFINGVLDKIAESLTAEGRIKKAGRGLL